MKAQSQRSIHPFMDKNYLRIKTVVSLLVLLMLTEKHGALALQGERICWVGQRNPGVTTSLRAKFCLKLWITFRFNFKYIYIFLTECGSVVSNTLISPGYPNNYPNNLDCNYSVPIPYDMAMKIYFHDFDVEYHPTCEWVNT